ncbi:hypothetical protein QBC34DRAFT_418096 [Podospora aff. communis PSN243]|uniref:Uncharacterized protein n=1 Tax=Podospora aff. communis PSN243 TaxID=3040156 RepID=A0AAV9G4D5_9PEZI|nr:hypothetical protein QBC34DRAFT_418096 [Podospora aff. communis PSN243]
MTSLWDDASTMNMRLPKVREKLSSLVRRGSSKTKKANTTGQNGVGTIAPILEVDLKQVESMRLAEGWLEDANSPPSPKKRSGRRGRGENGSPEPDRRNPEARYSATPIADLFSMSTDQLASTLQTISRKPVPAPAPTPVVSGPWTVAPPPVSPTTAPAAPVAAPVAKVTRREVRAIARREVRAEVTPAPPAPEPQPIRISLRHSVVEAVEAPEVNEVKSTRRRTVMSWSTDALSSTLASPTPDVGALGGPQKHAVREISLLRSVGPNTTGLRVSNGGGSTVGNGGSVNGSGVVGASAGVESTKRHSMTSMPSPFSMPSPAELQLASKALSPAVKPAVATPGNSAAPTPKSSTSDLRRRSWQPAAQLPPAPTSVPSSAAPGSMGPPLRRTPSTRPPSAALTSGRLAWIRELESKSSSSSGASKPELQKLKAPGGGGVAGKLAMFEHMQKKQPGPANLSRSNSTTSSRVSSGAMAESLFAGASSTLSFAGDALPSTARTSIDSTRSIYASHRSSAVLAYYDEEFREKMEGVAGGLSKQLKKGEEADPTASSLKKVTAQLVEVAKVKPVLEEPRLTEEPASISESTSSETVKEEQVEPRVEEKPADEPVSSVEAALEKQVEPKKEEKPAEVLAPVETSPITEEVEPVKEEVAQAAETPVSEEPSSTPAEVEESSVEVESPEPAKVEVPQAQPDQVNDAPAVKVEETPAMNAPVDAAAKAETPAPETKQPVIVVEEVAEAPSQDAVVKVAEQKIVEVQVVQEELDTKTALGGTEVVTESVVEVAAEPAAKLQEATSSS